MDSSRDPELGQASIPKDHVPKSEDSETLKEPLLQDSRTSEESGFVFTDKDGSVYIIPSFIDELVPRDAYVPLSSDPPHVLELKAEIRRLLSRLALQRERILADDAIRYRLSRSVTRVSVYHLAFMCAMCVAVFGGYVDGKPWSVAFWLMVAELGVLLLVLALKMVAMCEYDNRKQPEPLSLKLNFENMPAVRERLGEQEFKDFAEPLQMLFDRVCKCVVAEPVEPSYYEVVKSYFKHPV